MILQNNNQKYILKLELVEDLNRGLWSCYNKLDSRLFQAYKNLRFLMRFKIRDFNAAGAKQPV